MNETPTVLLGLALEVTESGDSGQCQPAQLRVSWSWGKAFPIAELKRVRGAGVGWDAPAGSAGAAGEARAEAWRASCLPPCSALPRSCLPFQKS